MNKYKPHIHHRRSIRLKGYDYSHAGLFFITICCQDRADLFGEIVVEIVGEIVGADLRVCPNTNAEMKLNDAGKMITKWYNALETKFPDIKCHEMIVMPNHFHFIIEIVGADPRVCPCVYPRVCPDNDANNGNINGEHVGSPLPRVIQWFKTMTTNEYIRGVKTFGWTPFNGKLWQRNYYERIIRNEQSYQTISKYIINNPAKWADDKFYKNKIHRR